MGETDIFITQKKNKFKSKKKINLKYTVHWPKETIRNKSTEFEKKNTEKCYISLLLMQRNALFILLSSY